MKEFDVIKQTEHALVKSDFTNLFKMMGIQSTDDVCVHTSMSKIGFIIGGTQTIIESLLETLNEGTILMPAHSGDFSDPAQWENPPVPSSWLDTIYEHMPAFDVEKSYLRGMGKVSAQFFSLKDTLRSNHPQTSFCAYGKRAEMYTEDHALTPMFGLKSPLGKLYEHNGYVVLLGVGFDRCTLFHVAEHLCGLLPKKKDGAPILVDQKRSWVWFYDDDVDSDDFPVLGQKLIDIGVVQSYKIGYGNAFVMRAKDAVDALIPLIIDLRYKK